MHAEIKNNNNNNNRSKNKRINKGGGDQNILNEIC